MPLTFNTDQVYSADSFGANAIGYAGIAKTLTLKDDMSLKRTTPKPTSTFSGVSRTTSKMTRTMALTGALQPLWDCIFELSAVIPVGSSAADVEAMRDDFAAFVATDEFLDSLLTQKISF